MKIDEVDINIIRSLQRDARTNFSDIANECNVSIDTIIKRFKKMKKNGVIRGTTILLNPKNLGYDCVVSLEIDVNFPHLKKVIDLIDNMSDVVFCNQSMGRHDIFAMAVLENVDELSRLKESLKSHPMITDVKTSIWVNELLLCPENFEFEHLKR